MSIIAGYSSGRVSVVKGTNQVTGIDTAWLAGAIREGDYFWVNGLTVKIASVVDNSNLVLAFPWPGASVTESVYEIRYTHDSQRVLTASRDLINKMNQGGLAPIGPLIPTAGGMIQYVNSNSAEIIVSGAKGRSLLQSINTQEAQTNLELIPQSNLIDATINRLLKTGSFGLGAINAPLLDNIDRSDIPAGFYKVDKTITLGTRPPLSDVADSLIVLHPTPSQTTQIYLGMTENGRNYIRKGNSTSSWSPWRSIVLDFESGTGPGSNLDADMVDGYHAADFVLRSELGQGSIVDLIKDSDGAGSGLDADLLDGHHADAFGRLSQASSWAAMQSFNEVVRVSASAHEQIQFGYGKTGINPTLSFYSNTTRTGFIQDGASAGLIIASGAGGQLLISGSGVVNINGKELATKEYIDNQISGLGSDPDFVEDINNQIAAKLDISSYTAEDILAKIKTVDGTSSGLDADLLDGNNSSYFQQNLNNVISIKLGSGLNTAGARYIDFKADGLSSTDYNARIIRHNGVDGSFDISQSGIGNIQLNGGGNLTRDNHTIWHAGNDGIGSTLDADLLDGREGSYYLDPVNITGRIDYNKLPDDLVKLTDANIFTKAVTINSGGIIVNNDSVYIRKIASSNANLVFDTIDSNNTVVRTRGSISSSESGILTIQTHGNSVTTFGSSIQLRADGIILFNAANGLTGNGAGLSNVAAATAATSVIAGNGLTGGGALTTDRSITLGTPGSITSTSTNSVTSTSHTHAFPANEVAKIIAEIPAGNIGSYALLRYLGSTDIGAGQTVAGSSLLYTNASGSSSGGAPSGTWRAMSRISLGTNEDRTTLFLRVA